MTTLKPTDHMLNAAVAAADEDGLHLWRDTAAEIVASVLTVIEVEHIEPLRVALEAVEALTKDTDGGDVDADADIPVGEIRRVIAEARARLSADTTEVPR